MHGIIHQLLLLIFTEIIDPKNNYFRIEEFSHNHISFVDGLNCNSGYFKLENLYKGSTTAAHEYGHTIGLESSKEYGYKGTRCTRHHVSKRNIG